MKKLKAKTSWKKIHFFSDRHPGKSPYNNKMLQQLKKFHLISAILLLILIPHSAQALPKPDIKNETSLVGIFFHSAQGSTFDDIKDGVYVNISGPRNYRFLIPADSWGVKWIKLPPGEYSFQETEEVDLSIGVLHTFKVPENSIFLTPVEFVKSTDGLLSESISDKHRLMAGERLAHSINYPTWINRTIIGFGTLRPTMDNDIPIYRITVHSEPDGAEVYIDDNLYGETPFEGLLPSDKYRIMVRTAGFQDFVQYIRLGTDADLSVTLTAQSDSSTPEKDNNQYNTIVAPFLSLDNANDQLSRLFADTLQLTLESDERLEITPSDIRWEQHNQVFSPDFRSLEKQGVDLAVSGFFYKDGNGQITIQACLYDVQAESIKANTIWTGDVGLEIYDGLDEIAARFAEEVNKVMPEAGNILITRQETVFSGVNRNEFLLMRKQVIKKRWMDFPQVFSIQTGAGAFTERYELSDSGDTAYVDKFESINFPLIFSWDMALTRYFSFGAGTSLRFGNYVSYQDVNQNPMTISSTWMTSLFIGPRFVLRSLRTDFFIGLEARVQYSPETQYKWETGVNTRSDTVGSFLYLGMPVKAGFRYYFNKRIDKTPFFITGTIGVSAFGYRFDLNGNGRDGWMGSDIVSTVGVGFRL